jgi:hypothetical protein
VGGGRYHGRDALNALVAHGRHGPAARRPAGPGRSGLTIVDASFVIASRGDGSSDRGLLMGATAVQGAAWGSGTVIGVPPARCSATRAVWASTRPWPSPRAPVRGPQPPRGRRRAGRRRHRLSPHALHAARRAVIAASPAALVGLRSSADDRVTSSPSSSWARRRAAGPVAFRRAQPAGRAAVVGLVAPALLGALVVYETVSAGGQGVVLDARLVGLAAAGLALVLCLPLIAVVLIAAVATALAGCSSGRRWTNEWCPALWSAGRLGASADGPAGGGI